MTLVHRAVMNHSPDFHAASQPMQAMRAIAPGRSVSCEFTARYAGVYLYHCGTPPMLEHLANGMFGGVIIDPPQLTPVPGEGGFAELTVPAAGQYETLGRHLDRAAGCGRVDRRQRARPAMSPRSHPPPPPCCLHYCFDKNNWTKG